ncbi:hypothetical protein KEX41_04780 [Burkholderia thailandensis]|uniref:hypothetical protein n=1 Tax=Burkholderia thailandensis TaxID=57975 RepID=UPI00192DDAAA|nr:hypothetical protein [Burkholderia thailandensis]MBS2127551.1 hypothetical protein [Burkholderia thailandensis]MCS6517949.1 hypothetical protein [Burkholderia thailandensis]QRA12030.1 hypothetical protein JMY07_05515 [Burkholderia thailandensis]
MSLSIRLRRGHRQAARGAYHIVLLSPARPGAAQIDDALRGVRHLTANDGEMRQSVACEAARKVSETFLVESSCQVL